MATNVSRERNLMGAAMALVLAGVAGEAAAQAPRISPAAKAAHAAAIVLDTHFDTPALFSRPGWDFTRRHTVRQDGSQVDVPRMRDGGVDGGFFVIYTAQGGRTKAAEDAARAFGLTRTVEIREMLARHPDKIELALTAADASRIAASGKQFVYLSMENATPLAGDPGMLQGFHALGVRMVGFVHFRNNGFADSATDKPEWGGLSPAGVALLAEMNRLGVVPDASHASDAVLEQAIALSKTPVVLSHSGARAIFDHARNVPDDLIRKLAAKGGVIQINALNGYMVAVPPNPAREKALAELQAKYAGRKVDQALAEQITAERRAILDKHPVPRADLDDLMKHIVHVINLVGVDHVGLSGDFDGGGGIDGFDSAADFPAVTDRLIKAGYTPGDVAKVMGGNILRVLRETESYVASSAK